MAVGGGDVDVGARGEMWDGSLTCSPPRRLNRTVTLPKSVCSPSATPLRDCSWGGALTKRIWSPDEAWRRWIEGRPPADFVSVARGRREESKEVMSMQIAWEEVMYDLYRSRFGFRTAGEGRGSLRPRISSLEIWKLWVST